MRLLLIFAGLVALGVLNPGAEAQDAPPAVEPAKQEEPKFPVSPLNVEFVKVGAVDLEKGTLEYFVSKTVFETFEYTVQVPVASADGKVTLVAETRTKAVRKCVLETRQMLLEGATLANPVGDKMSLQDAAKKMTLKNRDVILAMGGEIDPYYLKFLAKDVLIIVPPVAAPTPFPPAPIP